MATFQIPFHMFDGLYDFFDSVIDEEEYKSPEEKKALERAFNVVDQIASGDFSDEELVAAAFEPYAAKMFVEEYVQYHIELFADEPETVEMLNQILESQA